MKAPYDEFNIYIQLDDSQRLVFFNDVDYVEKNNNINKKLLKEFIEKNKNSFNIYYISNEKEFEEFNWISDDYSSDIVILKTSEFNEFKNNSFKNVFLIVDDEKAFLDSMVYLYNSVDGFIDFKLKNNFDSNILQTQFQAFSEFIVEQIKSKNYTEIKQLTKFFEKKSLIHLVKIPYLFHQN
jgi:hypothetical protein